ncbi:RagB/SusD family nutrient uptake outer membrane protein [Flavobacterium sp. NRK1]|uniref:RagB/SusD family nutrient uptake outer membrane protein n=1 Tax=Flavobacterium sp. NRK1 TaxID=2954929 RepID=UPI002093D033|nr:RagB/SusD family nutrient uptake outer membrane protein [Flavobacterium sp. NRK1]MCO6147418.1 RagB/SusD family nutrient uptake outer membrane protein [Flavobacterium sp. NRK1]
MKILNIKTISALVLASLMLASCDDNLDAEPISDGIAQNSYQTGDQIEAALIGVYESFQGNDYYVWDHVLFSDVRSDNHYAGGDNPMIFQLDAINVEPTNDRIYNAWSAIYNAIAKANVVLEYTPKVERLITEERRTQILGEARFLRAYHYYTLARLFGGVPLVMESVKSVDPTTIRVPRSTEQETYDMIISELKLAVDELPNDYGGDASVNKARATKGAAYALLAKAYAQQPVPNWGEVVNYANLVLNSPAGYNLMGSYSDLFDGSHYNNIESILEVQYLGGNEGTWGPQMHLPPSVSGDTWRKFVTPSHDLVNAYDAEGDNIRKNATILFENAPWADEYWGNEVGSSIPFAYKWKNAMGWQSSDHIYLLRLADIILLKAEALNATGQPGPAADEVDRIRTRVNLPVLTAEVRGSQDLMKAAILKERRLELAQEAHRWDDLVRNNVAVETMNAVQDIDLRTGNPVNYDMKEYEIFLPIPQRELNRNPNLVQNQGYN